MSKFLIAIFVALALANLGIASERSDVMAAPQKIVDAFNRGDSQAFLAACTEETAIVDEIPPHEWHGTGGSSYRCLTQRVLWRCCGNFAQLYIDGFDQPGGREMRLTSAIVCTERQHGTDRAVLDR